MTTFGQRVRDRRENLGMTQDELAKKLGYKSRSSVNKIELDQRNMKQSQIAQLAQALETTPGYLMGWKAKDVPLPSNVSVPAARPIPILGTIGCGEGPIGEENFSGYFFIDRAIQADYCLHTKGDSMIDAGIRDGDMVFLISDFDIEDGKIYGVVFGPDNEAVLKKVYRSTDHKVILQSCNSAYAPIIVDQSEVRVIGRLTWICHRAQ